MSCREKNNYLFVIFKKGRRKGQPFLQHSKISLKWITSFMACGVTFHNFFLKCTRSIQKLHIQLALLSPWRLTNQTCAETAVRIWDFCDSKEKKREREREQDTACQSRRKSQRRPLFKSCQHAEWEETCRRSKNKSRQGNLTFCAFFSPPLPWQSQSGAGVNAMKRKKRVEKKWKHDRLNCSGTPPTLWPQHISD